MWGQENRFEVFKYARVGTSARIELIDRSVGLRKEMGFEQSGLTIAEGEIYHTLNYDGVLDRYQPGLEIVGQVERNGDGFQIAQFNQRITHHNIHNWKTEVGLLRTQEEGVRDLGWFAELEYESEWAHFIEVETEGRAYRLLDYSRLEPAHIGSGRIELRSDPRRVCHGKTNCITSEFFRPMTRRRSQVDGVRG